MFDRSDPAGGVRNATCQEARKAVRRLRANMMTELTRNSNLDVIESCLSQQEDRIKRLERKLTDAERERRQIGEIAER